MTTTLHGQLPNSPDTALSGVLKSFSANAQWDDLRVAVAYASVAGLLHLLDVLAARKRGSFKSQWLFGLDDYLTQPGVLRTCLSMPNAELRTASLLGEGCRFHPKLYVVSQEQKQSLACVGSSNLTMGGMQRNSEAFAAITANTSTEISQLVRVWNGVWQLGNPTTELDIDKYEAEYNERTPNWVDHDDLPEDEPDEESEPQNATILTTDSPVIDPSLAKTCWIEVGRNTAMGRELEFKAEQALFFGLSPSGGPPQYRRFIVSSGNIISLRLKYQENAMWRLQMNNDIPEVAVGLRPRNLQSGALGRSPFVAIFTRTDNRNTFFLRFILDDSTDYATLRQQSARTGTIGRTSARRYGWC